MRSAVACIAALVLAGLGVFVWQRSQIASLRAQVARQGDVLGELSLRLGVDSQDAVGAPRFAKASLRIQPSRIADDGSAAMRADERRVILGEYRDVLSQLDLPPETASRLLDLLTERIETVLDAQDAAVREGFAAGSAQTARAVSLAIAEVDRDIVGLVGQDGIRRIDGLSVAATPTEVAPPAPAPAAPVIVTVVVQSPPSYEADPGVAPAATDAGLQYASYPYPYFPLYPVAAVLNGPRGFHRSGGLRNVEPGRREGGRVTFR